MMISLRYTKVKFKNSVALYGGFEELTDTLNSHVVGRTIEDQTVGEIIRAFSFSDLTFKYLVKVPLSRPIAEFGYVWQHHYELIGIE